MCGAGGARRTGEIGVEFGIWHSETCPKRHPHTRGPRGDAYQGTRQRDAGPCRGNAVLCRMHVSARKGDLSFGRELPDSPRAVRAPRQSVLLHASSNSNRCNSLVLSRRRRAQHRWPWQCQWYAPHHTPGQTPVTTASSMLRHQRGLQDQRVVHVPCRAPDTPPGRHCCSPCRLRPPCLPPPTHVAQPEAAAEHQRRDNSEEE